MCVWRKKRMKNTWLCKFFYDSRAIPYFSTYFIASELAICSSSLCFASITYWLDWFLLASWAKAYACPPRKVGLLVLMWSCYNFSFLNSKREVDDKMGETNCSMKHYASFRLLVAYVIIYHLKLFFLCNFVCVANHPYQLCNLNWWS